jgi:3-methyl-2-oxobutanoate hydroxymethyltransferase
MSSQTAPRRRVTIHELRRMKDAGEKIAVVTAYDATAARLADAAGVDMVLVGDSLGMVVQGHDSTLPVTLEHMIYHSAAVRRGLARSPGRAHLVGDMSFGSYQASADEAVKAAMRLVAEGGVESVKLEGGAEFVEVIRRIVRAGVPVMGHIGLTPQSVHRMGGYVVQGKDSDRRSSSFATRALSSSPAATRSCSSASPPSSRGSSRASSASPRSGSALVCTATARCSS